MPWQQPGYGGRDRRGAGIGRGIVERLADDGYRIVAIDRLEAVHDVADGLRAAGSTSFRKCSTFVTASPSVPDGAPRADRRDLVNNAAVTGTYHFEELTEEHFRETFDINAVGTFVVAQEGARRMPNGGRIVNIASRSFAGAPQMAHYAASETPWSA